MLVLCVAVYVALCVALCVAKMDAVGVTLKPCVGETEGETLVDAADDGVTLGDGGKSPIE